MYPTNLFSFKGCKSQEDCNDLEDCDVESSQCVPLQCTEPLQKVGGIIHLEGEDIKHKSVGATGSFRYQTYSRFSLVRPTKV